MQIKVDKKDIIWSYLGYFLKLGSNIIILPLVLTFLAEEELGMWYVFLSIGSLVTLLDFGFSPTIMRNISYCWSGAKELIKEGIVITDSNHNKEPNYKLFFSIYKVSKKMYFIISLVALVIMLSIGSIYIHSLVNGLEGGNQIMLAWFIFCFATFSNIYYSYWIPMLTGIGLIKKSQIATIISQSGFLIVVLIGLLLGYGLIAVSVAYCMNGIILRQVSKKFFINEKGIKKQFSRYRRKKNSRDQELFSIIWHNAYRQGIVSIGSFLTIQASTLICSSFIDLATTAKYGLTLQVFQMLGYISRIPFISLLPEFSLLRINNDVQKLKERFSLSLVIFWVSYITVSIGVVLFGNILLALIGSNTSFLSAPLALLMAGYLFLEFNHSTFATLITTKNEVPFVKSAIISGPLIVVLSIILVGPFKMGVIGMMLAQSVVQLCYNNWVWPLKVFHELNINISKIMEMGLRTLRISAISMFTKA
ncbi:MAG: hypothetical protein CVU84_14155 [Firmicutes bacterium HGW-Firmicutes-1]|jgi:O-antigen/teichoic acid export membrane protein|nr:MAG: hypothetical protein CVU84_14155 [Firmicutes bacterium HGW-Firmicutes-1]